MEDDQKEWTIRLSSTKDLVIGETIELGGGIYSIIKIDGKMVTVVKHNPEDIA